LRKSLYLVENPPPLQPEDVLMPPQPKHYKPAKAQTILHTQQHYDLIPNPANTTTVRFDYPACRQAATVNTVFTCSQNKQGDDRVTTNQRPYTAIPDVMPYLISTIVLQTFMMQNQSMWINAMWILENI
jgi:hypothetical protein